MNDCLAGECSMVCPLSTPLRPLHTNSNRCWEQLLQSLEDGEKRKRYVRYCSPDPLEDWLCQILRIEKLTLDSGLQRSDCIIICCCIILGKGAQPKSEVNTVLQ